MVEPKYNEDASKAPENGYPEQPSINFREHIGAFARYKLEEVASFAHGVNLTDLKEAGIDPRDIIRHRSEVQQAIRSMLAEGRTVESHASRDVAIAYVGALGFETEAAVLAGIANNPLENVHTRGAALGSLGRLGGEVSRRCLRANIQDPHPVIQEKAIRGLARIGTPGDRKYLVELSRQERNPELVRRCIETAHRLPDHPGAQHLPDYPGRDREKLQSVEEPSIVRSIGKVNVGMPQTGYTGEKAPDMFGGRDLIAEKLSNRKVPVPTTLTSFERLPEAPEGMARFRVVGKDLPIDDCCGDAVVHRLSPEGVIVDVPADQLKPGRPLPFVKTGAGYPVFSVWVPGANPSPKILGISPTQAEIWQGQAFQLRVRFHVPTGQSTPVLRLRVRLPLSGWHELLLPISREEQARGEKLVGEYRAERAGEISVEASLYASGGGADVAYAEFLSLPTNPISVNVVPQTAGTNGEGPAHYNSTENRYYCYARCTFVNGYPHSVTIGPTVTCRVTDGGSQVATFDFSIGTTTVSANSSRTINIYTSHGSSSDVYDVFKGFGDVTMEFTFQTSQEDPSDSNVWAAMAQLRLALNFVGDISAADRAAIQSITENEASAILEQQSLYISETRRFLLPSDHSDFNRYRDIEMEDNKDSDCTAGSDEADDLRDDWSSPTEDLDVWIVESFSGPSCAAGVNGFSPVNGPTAKGGSNSGYVIRRNGRDIDSDDGRTRVGRTIAHELGHFLGLSHHSDDDNFMFKTNGLTRTAITHGQYRDMADHGFPTTFVP
ncbi:MAG TPA: HEAT repeat domain-containing protein [Anaerolineales bacterium]|nr:HEAT repeat domain-containing protein [Anaerolineales bacterium]